MKFFNIEIGEELQAAAKKINIKDDVTLIYAPKPSVPIKVER